MKIILGIVLLDTNEAKEKILTLDESQLFLKTFHMNEIDKDHFGIYILEAHLPEIRIQSR